MDATIVALDADEVALGAGGGALDATRDVPGCAFVFG